MNNKFFAGLLVIIVMLAGCDKKTNEIFDKTPDQRLADTLNAYQSALTGAANGWRVILNPGGGGTYSFYMKFNNQNRVTMFSDINAATGTTGSESSYRLKAVQRPSLIFDTYSYIHLLSDPTSSVLGGETGKGYSSDFDFAIVSVSADTIKLKGNFNGSNAYMVKATKAEGDAAVAGGIGNNITILQKLVNYFKRLTISGKTYEIIISDGTHIIMINYLDASGNLRTFTSAFYYGPTGIVLLTPFVDGATTIAGFTNISYNAATETINVTSGTASGQITGTGQPLKVDLGAPKRWWQLSVDQSDYWISLRGFHVNGVDDGFNMKNIAGIYSGYYMLYWGNYNPAPYDAFSAVRLVNNSLNLYGPAVTTPTFTSDGKAIFTYLGHFGGTLDATSTTIINNVRTQITIPEGYYFIQTGALRYDMVSAKDGKAWISWIF